MEGSRLVKKVAAKFEPIGEILSPETAFIQASNALDVAGAFAQEAKDIEGLNTVASLYIELAARLMHASEEEEEEETDEEALSKKIPLGYKPQVIVPEQEKEQEITADE